MEPVPSRSHPATPSVDARRHTGHFRCVSTISAIFEPAADGTVHLPIPAAWGKRAIRVTAELEPVERPAANPDLKGFGCLRGRISMAKDFDEPLADFAEYT